MVLITINPMWRSLRIAQKTTEEDYQVYKGSLLGSNLSEIKYIEIHTMIMIYFSK